MKRIFFSILFVLILFPISSTFSQVSDTPPTLAIQFTSFTPNLIKDDDGYSIILGEIQNIQNFPLTDVKIRGFFYDDISEQPLEAAFGQITLEVIPPFGKSPYMIRSITPNAAITNVSVDLMGFISAVPKTEVLEIESEVSDISDRIKILGSISHTAENVSTNTKVHLYFYDVFQPHRILGLHTQEIGEIESGASISFEFDEKFDNRSIGYTIFAESENYYSRFSNVEIIQPDIITKLVTINDVSINDSDGNKLSTVSVGTHINIQSNIWIQYSSDQESYEQPYVYYAQVKQSGEKAFVEFIGTYEGSFQSAGSKFPAVEWTPEDKGIYFVETFVWDPTAVPLASKGPIMLVLVT